jgi:hypothetical protein
MEGRPHRLALKPFDKASGNDSYLRKRDSVSDMAGVDVQAPTTLTQACQVVAAGAEMHGDQLVPMGAVGRFPRWFTHSYCSRSPKDAAGCEQPQALGSVSMDCVGELAKSPDAKTSISRAEPDLRGPVGAPSGNDRSLRI